MTPHKTLLFLSAITLACAPRPAPEPDPTGQVQGALGDSRFGVNIDVDNGLGNPSGATLASANARWARFTFKDGTDWTTDPDPAQVSRYVQKLDDLRAHGVQALVLLNYETVPGFPAFNDDPGAHAWYRERFADRVRKIARALGDRPAAYEIWNEPDEPNPRPDYAPNMRPEYYGQLLRDAYLAIRESSSAEVISGGADSGQVQYLVDAANATGGLYADGIGLHPYGQRPDPSWPYSTWGFGYLGNIVPAYHSAFGLPVWITEIGTEDTSIQADYLSRTFARVRALGSQVKHVLWFCWSDPMVWPMGLIGQDGQPKDSYWSFRAGAQGASEPERPTILAARFSSFWIDGDEGPTVRADIDVDVPSWAGTQPMGTSAASCDWYWPGEGFRARYPEIGGAWRVAVDVWGPSSARDNYGLDHPWRWALNADGCGMNWSDHGEAAQAGRYTITGFFKLGAWDDQDLSHYYAGMVQENVAWTQDGVQ